MTLQPGAKLAQYEVVSSLGAGGMGEVYRARDTRLGREVAIKLLLEEVSSDPERLARFEREARVLASLNHPNIATLLGFEQEGQASARSDAPPRSFLVMELVEGETLADRIARGPLSVEEAIPLFLDIAAGLEAAHEKGIIHRDLKPANVKICGDGSDPAGRVKVLDFGLAKALDPESAASESASVSMSPTLTLAATGRGQILGTAAYMSPEQARGKPVDKRADIWAFGVCLFEALTGEPPFVGEDAAEVLGAALTLEPDVSRVAGAGPVVERVVRRCLAKDPRQRLRDIGDVRLELESATERVDDAPPLPRRSSWPRAVAAAVLAAVTAAGATSWWWSRQPRDTSARVARADLELEHDGTPLRVLFAGWQYFDLAPDGDWIVFNGTPIVTADNPMTVAGRRDSGGGRLYLRSLRTGRTIPIEGTEDAFNPVISPDSRWLAFTRDSALWRVRLQGGEPLEIARLAFDRGAAGIEWPTQEHIVVGASRFRGLQSVPASGGELTPLTEPEDEGVRHIFPNRVGATGSLFFTVRSQEASQLAWVSLAEGEVRLLDLPIDSVYTVSGHLLHTVGGAAGETGGSLIAVPFDLDRMQFTGPPAQVVEGIRSSVATSFAVSLDGTLVYDTSPFGSVAGRVVAVDRNGREETLLDSSRSIHYPRPSPDSRWMAMATHTESSGDNHDLMLMDLVRSLDRILVAGGENHLPVWHPREPALVFARGPSRFDDLDLYRVSIDGGAPEPLLERPGSQYPRSFTADGSLLLFEEDHPQTGADLWVLPMDGGEPRPFLTGAPNERAGAFSPGGRWVAYVSDQWGVDDVYLRPYPGPGEAVALSNGGGVEPQWSPNGREVFFREGANGRFLRVEVDPEGTTPPGPPQPLLPGYYAGSYNRRGPGYGLLDDGERFAVMAAGSERRGRFSVVFNWFEELKRVAPPG